MTDERPLLIIYTTGRYELLERLTVGQMQAILAAIGRDIQSMAIGPTMPPVPVPTNGAETE